MIRNYSLGNAGNCLYYPITTKLDKSYNIQYEFKGWCKKNVTTIVKLSIAAFRGCNCILYWLVKLITVFLTFQKAIQTIFIGFANSDDFFYKIEDFAKNNFALKLM